MTDVLPLARLSDPATSHEAAEAQRSKLTEAHQTVLSVLQERPCTGPELVVILAHWRNNTAAKRLSDLKRLGRVVATGERRRLFGQRDADVYRLADFVRAHQWVGLPPGEIVAQWEADQRSGRVDSLRECPAWRCRGLAPFTSRTGFSRHLSQVHGWDA